MRGKKAKEIHRIARQIQDMKTQVIKPSFFQRLFGAKDKVIRPALAPISRVLKRAYKEGRRNG